MTHSVYLMSRALHAAAWGYAGTIFKLVMQLGVQIYLARLLGPSEYGLFAIGVMVVSFALFFGDVGSTALIQRQLIRDEEIRFAFTWQMIVSIMVSVMIALLAEPIASYVHEPRAENVIRVLGVICTLNAIGGVALALLRHNLDFKSIQIAQVVGYFVGYVLLALPFAIFVEPSVNALVVAWLTQVFVTSVIYLYRVPHSWRPRFTCDAGLDLVKFGAHSAIANFGTWALTNADKIVVARLFPVAQVGIYTSAANLMSTPLSQIYATFQQVAFSASAKISTEDAASRVFASITSLVIVFSGLGYVFSLTTADTLVAVLYGYKWKAAVPFIQAFSVTMFFHAVSGVVTPFLWAHGAIGKDAKIQAGMALAVAGGAFVMGHWSALAVAWWVAVVFGLRVVVLLWVGSRVFSRSRSLLREVLANSLIYLACAGATLFFTNYLLGYLNTTIIIKFLLNLLMLAILALIAIKFRKLMGSVFTEAINLLFSKMPLPIMAFIDRLV